MDNIKSRSGMLMTKGVMQMKTDPPSFVCAMRTFRHPVSGKTVTLQPIPNIAAPAYFKRMLEGNHLRPDVDVVLCEDGRLPFLQGSMEARKQQLLKAMFPYFGFRPIVSEAETSKFDGVIDRDPMESRMAYTSVTQALTPSVDSRARRAVERLETYPDNTRVVCPWNVYHLVYMSEKLPAMGYDLVKTEEVTVIDQKNILMLVLLLGFMSMVMGVMFVRLVFGM